MPDDHEWLEPEDEMGIWEHQGRPLTKNSLVDALTEVNEDHPIEIHFYDGVTTRRLRPMHIDVRVGGDAGPAVVITVA